jgi:hypothetical protein
MPHVVSTWRVVWKALRGISRILIAGVGILGFCQSALAQTGGERRVQIGMGVSLIRFVDFDAYLQQLHEDFPQTIHLHSWNDPGPQLIFTLNVSPSVGVEAAASLLPRWGYRGGFPSRGGAKALWQVGVVGRRKWGNTVALVGSVRAGGASFTQAPEVRSGGANSAVVIETGAARTYPCLYVAGGLEVGMTSRAHLRGLLGDLLVDYRPYPRALNPSFVRHNGGFELDLAIGFGSVVR